MLAKGKSNKSVSLLLSHIGPKQKLRVDRKILGWVWSKMGVATLVLGLLNWSYLIKESIEQTDFFNGDTNLGYS